MTLRCADPTTWLFQSLEVAHTHDVKVRIMRVLTAMKFAAEAGEESYVATPISRVVAAPIPEAGILFW